MYTESSKKVTNRVRKDTHVIMDISKGFKARYYAIFSPNSFKTKFLPFFLVNVDEGSRKKGLNRT